MSSCIKLPNRLNNNNKDSSNIKKTFAENFSSIRNKKKSINLTDNKEIYYKEKEIKENSNKLKDPFLAQREAEYDKNLKRIKRNLLDKFENYRLNDNIYTKKNIIKFNSKNSKSKNNKIFRERSRNNIKENSSLIICQNQNNKIQSSNNEKNYFKSLRLDDHSNEKENESDIDNDNDIDIDIDNEFGNFNNIENKGNNNSSVVYINNANDRNKKHLSSSFVKDRKKRFMKKLNKLNNVLFSLDKEAEGLNSINHNKENINNNSIKEINNPKFLKKILNNNLYK
jgi:hypothetical protein